MGLDTSHNCWHGAYSAFMRWRRMLARVSGLPPLDLMEGFFRADGGPAGNPFFQQYDEDLRLGYAREESIWSSLPIRWDSLKPDPIHELLHHSDCDGELPWESCSDIADRLERLLLLLPEGDAGGHIGDWRQKTRQFIDGLRDAHSKQENVVFH